MVKKKSKRTKKKYQLTMHERFQLIPDFVQFIIFYVVGLLYYYFWITSDYYFHNKTLFDQPNIIEFSIFPCLICFVYFLAAPRRLIFGGDEGNAITNIIVALFFSVMMGGFFVLTLPITLILLGIPVVIFQGLFG